METGLHYARNLFLQALSIFTSDLNPEISGTTKNKLYKIGTPERNTEDVETSRFFFWISPNFNIDFFIFILPFALIPVALVWIFIIYPPGKFYANVPYNRNGTATVFEATEGLFRKKRFAGPYPIVLQKSK